jgi:bla regulator protein BlaR1
MRNSVNWYFQNLDSNIGIETLKKYYTKIGYGNLDLSGGISNYWLESSLKISAIEQVELLKAFYSNAFAFNNENIQTVKNALRLSESEGALLSGKTGTGNINGKNISGWFIGYVENSGKTYFFATHIQSDEYSNGSMAAKITLSILNDKNIYVSKQ